MATYIIDYENVSVDGMKGLSELTAEDNLYIFYSEKADRMTFDLYRRLSECRARQEFFCASVGTKNALDFQLVSILGYKVARDEKAAFVIVSRDKGFDCVVKLWASRGVTITRATSIGAALTGEPPEEPAAKPATKTAAAQKAAPIEAAAQPTQPPANATNQTEKEKTNAKDKLRANVKSALGKKYAAHCDLSVKALLTCPTKQELYDKLFSAFKNNTALTKEVYNHVKPLMKMAAKAAGRKFTESEGVHGVDDDLGERLSRLIDPQYVNVALEAMDARKSKQGVHDYLVKKIQNQKTASEIYKTLRKNHFLDDKS